MSTSISLSSPAISVEFLSGERPAVRTLELAQHFGIKHKNVLQDIKNMMSKLPDSFTGLNFQLSEYQDTTGRKLPCYLLTRDAFTLLVMGWNSPRAMEWKLRYIEAFNALERAALENARQLAQEEAAKARLEGVAEGARAALAIPVDRLQTLARVVRYRSKGLTHSEIGKLLDMGTSAVNHALRQARMLGLGEFSSWTATGCSSGLGV